MGSLFLLVNRKWQIRYMQDEGVKMILVGDIGGTHTRLAFFEKGKVVGEEKKFSSQKYKNLEAIVAEFLQGKKIEKACFGVAGPIRNGKCKITNLPWVIDREKLGHSAGIGTVFLLNDLEANAWGLKGLKKEELFLLHQGEEEEGNRALISAGTGLGEAGLYWDGKEHRPFPCEGGHADFAPRDEKEVELWRFLKKKFQHVSWERVISGPGLVLIFQFLIETKREVLSQQTKEKMREMEPAKVITESEDPACKHAVEWFLSMYGSESGNLALKMMALNGVFVGGGIAPKLVKRFAQGDFLRAFQEKGRFKELLETISVWVVLNENTALIGAGIYGERQ